MSKDPLFVYARRANVRWLANALSMPEETARSVLESDDPSYRRALIRQFGAGLEDAKLAEIIKHHVEIKEEMNARWSDLRAAQWRRERGILEPRADAPLATHGGDRRSASAREQSSDRRLKYGDNDEYWLARLRRDRQDLAAKVEAGEQSAKEAATMAGLRKPTRPETAPRGPPGPSAA